MENSELEDMEIQQQMLSEAKPQPLDGVLTDNFLPALNKNNSILSLTLDEIQCKSGKNLGGMSMDEFLANIWNAEEIHNQIHSQPNENEPQNHPFMIPPTNNNNNTQQSSFSIPIPLCGKTVDEIWSEIHKDQQQQQQQQHSHRMKFENVHPNPWQSSQQALGEMTLEDFLVKAGVVQESSSSMKQQMQCCSPKQMNNNNGNGNNSNCNTIFRSSMVDLGYGMGDKLGLSLTYQQNAARNMSGNCFSTYQMLTQSVGEPSDQSSIQNCQSLTDWVEQSSKKRIIDGPPEVVVQRRQRRMIKNRESAARSRARKQAYTVELEVELNQLKEENVKLKEIVAESERNRKQEIMQRKQCERRQKPTERLRTMRRIASMAW